MLHHERLEFADERRVAAQSERGLDVFLDREDAKLVETGTLGSREIVEDEVGERGAAPEAESLLDGC
jgi:hypothetical protein